MYKIVLLFVDILNNKVFKFHVFSFSLYCETTKILVCTFLNVLLKVHIPYIINQGGLKSTPNTFLVLYIGMPNGICFKIINMRGQII